MASHDLPPLGTMVEISEKGRRNWYSLRNYAVYQAEVVGHCNHYSYLRDGYIILIHSPLLEGAGNSRAHVEDKCSAFLYRGVNGYWWLREEDYAPVVPLSIEDCM